MKKANTSLLKKITRLFLIILLISFIGMDILQFASEFTEKKKNALELTRHTVSDMANSLDAASLKKATEDPYGEDYKALRSRIRKICIENRLQYLYIFVPDFENNTITYLVSAANDDASDQTLLAERYAGAVVESSFTDEKKSAWVNSEPVSLQYSNQAFGGVLASYHRLTDDAGKSYALIGADYSTKDIYVSTLTSFAIRMLIRFINFMLIFFLMVYFIKKKVVMPITLIEKHMNAFTQNPENDFEAICINTHDEIESVANSFNHLGTEVQSYIKKIQNYAANEARVSTEIEVARNIQYGIVASSVDCSLSASLALSGRMQSAKMVGGDFYDYFSLSPYRHCILIGDVSGKGMGAAMFMMLSKAIMREKIQSLSDLEQAVINANIEICRSNPEMMFITLFAAVIDEKENKLAYVNAGHNPPVIISKSGATEQPVKSGMALGVFDDIIYESREISFSDIDGIFLYTDGVTECNDAHHSFYGKERLLDAISHGRNTTNEICTNVLASLREYMKNAEQFDDITMLCVLKKHQDETTLPISLSGLHNLREFIEAQLPYSTLLNKINCVCEEWYVNLINYSGATQIHLTYIPGLDPIFIFCDNGAPFNPLDHSSEKSFDDFDTGGMGITIIKNMTKDISYQYKDGTNQLTMTFGRE